MSTHEIERHILQAKAYALLVEVEAGRADETTRSLVRKYCSDGLYGDEQTHKTRTKEQDAELKEIALKRLKANEPNWTAHNLAVKLNSGKGTVADRKRFDKMMENPDVGGKGLVCFLADKEEADRVRYHEMMEINRRLGVALDALGAGNGRLADALKMQVTGYVQKINGAMPDTKGWTETEKTWLALRIVPKRFKKKQAVKRIPLYPSIRDIAATMGINPQTLFRKVKRREGQADVKAFLALLNAQARKPRGKAVTTG